MTDRKIKAIKKDLKNNIHTSYDVIANRNNVTESQVEQIDSGEVPDEEPEPENTCSFCGVPCEDYFCSDDCKIAEVKEND